MPTTSEIISQYIDIIKASDFADTTKRRYCDCLGNFRRYLNNKKVRLLGFHDVNGYFEHRMKSTGREMISFKQDNVAINKFLVYAVSIGHINNTEDFKLKCRSSNDIIRLFSKSSWEKIDDLVRVWISEINIDDEEQYRRNLIRYYILFMSKARPITSTVAEAIRWRQIAGNSIIFNDGNAITLTGGSINVLDQWKHLSVNTKYDDIVFIDINNEPVDFLSAIFGLLIDIKVYILGEVKRNNFGIEITNTHKASWDTIMELYGYTFEAVRIKERMNKLRNS